jgi:hypothetical protein
MFSTIFHCKWNAISQFFFNFRNLCASVVVFRNILQNILQYSTYMTKDRDTYTYITEIEKNLEECLFGVKHLFFASVILLQYYSLFRFCYVTQSTRWIINAAYVLLLLQAMHLLTASIRHQAWEVNTYEFFLYVIAISMVQDLNLKNVGVDLCCVDYPLRFIFDRFWRLQWSGWSLIFQFRTVQS